MEKYPGAIIATVYSEVQHSAAEAARRAANPSLDSALKEADFPYIYLGYGTPSKNPYPESPTFPLISPDRIQTGMIDVDTNYNADGVADSVPRWVPIFAETEGPEHTDNIISGYLAFNGLDPALRMDQGDTAMVLNPDGGAPYKMPRIQDITFYNLSIKLALAYLGLDERNVKRTPDDLQIVAHDGTVLIDIPLREQQLVEINWFSKWDNQTLNERYSFLQVTDHGAKYEAGTPEEQAAAKEFFKPFKDAIVLIGPVDPILQDLAPTPFDAEAKPKVGVYGNLLKTIFTGDYIHRLPKWTLTLLQFALTLVVGGLAVYSGSRAGLAKVAAVFVLFAYILGVFEAFKHFTLVLPLVVPVGSAFSTAFVGAVVRLIDEEKQKKRIKGMFSTYLAPEVVNDMVGSGKEPQLGGHNVVITCFFSDVQGFSTFSEVMTPGKLTDLMNEYLTAMTDILQAERGSLDKYIGDAIVAMYGAPVDLKDHALRACVATCLMQKRLGELRQKWIGEGEKWPERVHQHAHAHRPEHRARRSSATWVRPRASITP